MAVNLDGYISYQTKINIECKKTEKCKQDIVIEILKRNLVISDTKVLLLYEKHQNNELNKMN